MFQRLTAMARAAAVFLALATVSCEAGLPTRDVYVLLDVSASYYPRLVKASDDLKYVVLGLRPSDSLVVAYIQSCSFADDAKILDVELDPRESSLNRQKPRVMQALKSAIAGVEKTSNTDITGAIVLAAQHMQPSRSRRKALIILSDMKEDLPPDCSRPAAFDADLLKGVTVILANVGRSADDNADLTKYTDRVRFWTDKLSAAGADVRVVNNMRQAQSEVDRL